MPCAGCAGYREIALKLSQSWLKNWQPGKKLPKYEVLRNRMKTTQVTLQRAMTLLSEQGFIHTRPTVGSYLSERPPHECNIGIVFNGHPEGSFHHYSWTRESLALFQAAMQLNASQQRWRFRFYIDTGAYSQKSGFARLQQDVQMKALGGLIFLYSPHEHMQTAFLQKPSLPIAHHSVNFPTPGFSFRHGEFEFLGAVAHWAKRCGVQRIAYLSLSSADPALLTKNIHEVGLPVRPEWMFGLAALDPKWLPHVLCSLFSGKQMPDAIVITDDHLVEPTVDCLLQMKSPVNPQPKIVGLWNLPLPYQGKLSVDLIGNSAVRRLQACMQYIEQHPEPPKTCGPILELPYIHLTSDEIHGGSTLTLASVMKEAEITLREMCQDAEQ